MKDVLFWKSMSLLDVIRQNFWCPPSGGVKSFLFGKWRHFPPERDQEIRSPPRDWTHDKASPPVSPLPVETTGLAVAATAVLLGLYHRRIPDGRAARHLWLVDTSSVPWCERRAGGHETVREPVLKWRCLKEQRKKFVTTMTVNVLRF